MLLQLTMAYLLTQLDKSSEQNFEIWSNPKAIHPDWGTFTVKLDHHNPLDRRTFKLRYLNSSVFFKDGGPIFIFLGGSSAISEYYLMSGQMFDMASQHDGYMFYLEHRYYGKSHATEDYTLQNLNFLTTEQALEDVAKFVAFQKSLDKFKESMVIVVGGSYSATIATWIRLKYPHLIDIAYSSSPLLLAKTDFYEYLEAVNDAINQTDTTCLNIIQSGIQEIVNELNTPDGRKHIAELFRLCDEERDLTNTFEKSYFFGNIIWPWDVMMPDSDATIRKYCKVIHSTAGSPAQKLAAFVNSYYPNCLDSYADHVKMYSDTSLDGNEKRRSHYQACTEYGHFQTTSSDKQPFGKTLPLQFYRQRCLDFFGPELTSKILDRGVNRINLQYGHLEPELTKVVSVYDTTHPWHSAGGDKDLNEDAPKIVVKGASGGKDLLSANPTADSKELYAAKVQIKQIIGIWLGKIPESHVCTGGWNVSMTLESSIVILFSALLALFIVK